MLGLADYFAHRKEKPARTLVFMVSGGHHTAVGAAAFIKAHPEIIKDTVLVMNLEHLAQINVTQAARLDPAGPGGYGAGFWTANTTETTKQAGAVNATPYVWELMGKASKLYGVVTSYEPTPSAPGDLGSYIRAGLPSAQLISSEAPHTTRPATRPRPSRSRAWNGRRPSTPALSTTSPRRHGRSSRGPSPCRRCGRDQPLSAGLSLKAALTSSSVIRADGSPFWFRFCSSPSPNMPGCLSTGLPFSVDQPWEISSSGTS